MPRAGLRDAARAVLRTESRRAEELTYGRAATMLCGSKRDSGSFDVVEHAPHIIRTQWWLIRSLGSRVPMSFFVGLGAARIFASTIVLAAPIAGLT